MLYAGARGMGHLVSGESGPAALLWGGETVSSRQPIFTQQQEQCAGCNAVAGGTRRCPDTVREREVGRRREEAGPLTVRKGCAAVCRPYSLTVNTDL